MASNAKALLKEFTKRQEQRANSYSELRFFFKRYLGDRDVKTYQSSCKSITKKFKAIGDDILKIEKELIELKRNEWAAHIRQIQDNEKAKLQLTVKIQVLKTKYLLDRQDKDAPEYTSTLRSYQRQMATIIEKINDTLEEIKYILHEDD
mmetsp:Transcript_26427/g.42464  ORF Transcript_26427/g.42464 Transcript_26427/m.42464 type:complete len:149 (+) Transcript_26427:103-549(+)|eukprot:jgi/Bigna1/87138/estExt_fgenesh1_pg.C_170053